MKVEIQLYHMSSNTLKDIAHDLQMRLHDKECPLNASDSLKLKDTILKIYEYIQWKIHR